MPGYVLAALKKYQHEKPTRPQHAPHRWNQPAYGKHVQYADPPDQSERLDTKGQRLIQSIVGTFLYYGRALDNTILCSLNDIGTQQASPTKNTIK